MTLRELVDTLRDRNQWPEGFQWNYGIASRCAVGLGRLGAAGWPEDQGLTSIFCGAHIPRGLDRDQITADMVADDLELLLDARDTPAVDLRLSLPESKH